MTSIGDQLDGLRRALTGCRLIAFGDLGAELVLLTSGPERCAQEYLDEIGVEAGNLFRAQDAVGLSGSAETLFRFGISVLMPHEMRLYMRGAEADFLCLVSEDPLSGLGAAAPAHRLLARIARGNHD